MKVDESMQDIEEIIKKRKDKARPTGNSVYNMVDQWMGDLN